MNSIQHEGAIYRLFYQTIPAYINLIAFFVFVIPFAIYWENLSPCFQRQGLIISMTLLYWQFKKLIKPGFIAENLHFFVPMLLVEKLNSDDNLTEESCLKISTLFTNIIFISYLLLYGYYLGRLIILMILLIITGLNECYYRIIRLPSQEEERQSKLTAQQFQELERIQYTSAFSNNCEVNKISCSICLIDFQLYEEVIRLPKCDHLYHIKCIEGWLLNHNECPYCRSDVIKNLKKWKSDQEKGDQISLIAPKQAPIGKIESLKIRFSSRQQKENNRHYGDVVYIELRDF